jgi:hypothetical protein
MADVVFNAPKRKFLTGAMGDLSAAGTTLKVMLVTAAYVPDQDLHEFKSSVTNEVTGTGYTAGGAALANKSATQDNTDNEGVLDADDVTWANSTITARAAVLYRDTGVATTSDLLGYYDFLSDKVSSGGSFTIQWNSEGLINIG